MGLLKNFVTTTI